LKGGIVLQQSSIFGKLNFGGGMSKDEAKKLESLIAQKANKPKKSRTTTVVGTAGGRAGLFEKLQTIKTMAEKYLVDDGTCICITNEMEYYNYMTKAKRNGKLAIDTETKGLNVISDEMVGLCLYTPGESGICTIGAYRFTR
jgi:hypothetical protein